MNIDKFFVELRLEAPNSWHLRTSSAELICIKAGRRAANKDSAIAAREKLEDNGTVAAEAVLAI